MNLNSLRTVMGSGQSAAPTRHCTAMPKYITEGYSYAVDIDLEKFFDKVNHSKLIEVLSRKVKDGRVISLIHKYLNAGV
jgi:retron-type reverse transcriptase